MSEEFRALMEVENNIVTKRFKMLGFVSQSVVGNVANPPTRTQRILYNGVGVFVPQAIVVNSFATNWTLGGNIRPNIATCAIRDKNMDLILPTSEFFNAENNFIHWAYDNLDSGVNFAPQEYIIAEFGFVQAATRTFAGAIIGTEYLLDD